MYTGSNNTMNKLHGDIVTTTAAASVTAITTSASTTTYNNKLHTIQTYMSWYIYLDDGYCHKNTHCLPYGHVE